MKFYIVYDNQNLGVLASNIVNKLNHNAVLSDEEIINVPNVIKDVASKVDEYDKIIILNKNPKIVEIQANKLQNIQAAVCKDADDIKEINSIGVNVIVINSDIDKENLEYLFNLIIDNQNTTKRTFLQQRQQNQKQNYDTAKNFKTPEIQKITPDNLKTSNLDYLNKTSSDNTLKQKYKINLVDDIKKKGFTKFLKDSLGIED
ncbi:MAG: hypothetical protein ACP5UN_02595 [Candidatus Micrarchaeia archaeon]